MSSTPRIAGSPAEARPWVDGRVTWRLRIYRLFAAWPRSWRVVIDPRKLTLRTREDGVKWAGRDVRWRDMERVTVSRFANGEIESVRTGFQRFFLE